MRVSRTASKKKKNRINEVKLQKKKKGIRKKGTSGGGARVCGVEKENSLHLVAKDLGALIRRWKIKI